MAGIKLGAGASVISFAVTQPGDTAEVVTVSGSSAALAGVEPGRAKRSFLTEFPAKGRATGGVRAHAFLKGEDSLRAAFVGVDPVAVAADGKTRALPDGGAKRDASGTPLDSAVETIGTRAR